MFSQCLTKKPQISFFLKTDTSNKLWKTHLDPFVIHVGLHGEVAEQVDKLGSLPSVAGQLRPQLPEDVDDDGPEVDGGVLEDGDDESVRLPTDRRRVAVQQEPLDEGEEQVRLQIFAHLVYRKKSLMPRYSVRYFNG